MLLRNSGLRLSARRSLQGNWSTAAVICLFYWLFNLILIPFVYKSNLVGSLFCIFITPILLWGLQIIYLYGFRKRKMKFENIFNGFTDYGRIWGTLMLTGLYTILWSLLFVIPGIIKSYSYAMTPYLLHDEPDLSFNEAILTSKKMMQGNKMQLFLLDLSFIGWYLLCLLTAGIGFLWLIPYMLSSRAAFYDKIKTDHVMRVKFLV